MQSMLVVAWHTALVVFSRRSHRGDGRPVARFLSSLGRAAVISRRNRSRSSAALRGGSIAHRPRALHRRDAPVATDPGRLAEQAGVSRRTLYRRENCRQSADRHLSSHGARRLRKRVRQGGERRPATAQTAGKVEDVLRVFTTYRHTAAGLRALAVAAGIFFDRGQFMEAAAASRQLLDLPDAAEQPSAAARLVLSWMRLGASDQARRWIDGRRTVLANSQIEVEGHRYPLDRWLDELCAAAATRVCCDKIGAQCRRPRADARPLERAHSHHAFALDQAAERDRHLGRADRRTDRPAGRLRHRPRFSWSAAGRR